MLTNNLIEEQDSPELQFEDSMSQKFHPAKPVEIQLKLVASELDIPRNVKSVTLTLSSLNEAWHIFEDLTNLAWEKIIQK